MSLSRVRVPCELVRLRVVRQTAEMGTFYAPGEYDLAGFCVGVAERSDLLDGTAVEPWLKLMRPFVRYSVPRASREIAAQSRGARLRLALQELGPIFVKFGQILSTRRDLVPLDVADELTLLQDRVAPFGRVLGVDLSPGMIAV